jgi:phage tail sheath gpL-like
MPLTAITLASTNRLKIGTPVAQPSTAAIDATNGNTIAKPVEGWDRVVLEITNTFAGAKSATIAKGVGTQSILAADLTKSMAQNEVWYIPVSPSARFEQADGSITLTYTAGMTGTVRVFVLPVGL